MKKKMSIIIVLFITSTVLYSALKYVVNTQFISRILYDMDLNTYMNMQMQNINGFIGLLSNEKMPYEWIFTLSNYTIIVVCIIVTYIMTRNLGKKYSLNKKEITIAMIIFSILSLYELIYSLIIYHRIISLQILKVPILFVITAIIGTYKNIYKK